MTYRISEKDLLWDIGYHIYGNGKKDIPERIRKDYLQSFRNNYRIPSLQKALRPIYFSKKMVYLSNAFSLKYNREIKDLNYIDILTRMNDFRKRNGIKGNNDGVRFLVRVDDFPRWDRPLESFLEFHDIARSFDINYLLGATPYLTDDPFKPSKEQPDFFTDEEIDILKMIQGQGADISLHGLTHRTLYQRYHTEVVGLSRKEIRGGYIPVLEKLKGMGIKTRYVMPPFNSVDYNNFGSFEGLFEGIIGGPESLSTMGYRPSPSRVGDTLYIPSYPPFYDVCRNIIKAIEVLKNEDLGGPTVILAMHWNWEVDNGYKFVKKMFEMIGQDSIKWKYAFDPGR